MERRKALALISAAAAGTLILPSCNFESIPQLSNFEIDKAKYKLLKAISNKILPIPEEQILENLSPTDFLLTMMDDCRPKEDIEKFTKGLSDFQIHLKDTTSIVDMEYMEIQSLIENKDDVTNEIPFFIENVKRYNVQYYKSLEQYLSEYTDWEFAPGRFKGCVKV